MYICMYLSMYACNVHNVCICVYMYVCMYVRMYL